MNEFAARIERDFPLRRKEKEKMEFRTWLVHTFKELGYTPKLESGESVLAAGGSGASGIVTLSAGIICAGLSIFMFFGCRETARGILILTRKITIVIKNRFIGKGEA